VLAELRNPVAIVTKNHLVTRDIDLLKELARWNACAVFVSVTTLRKDIVRVMEPRASSPEKRLQAIRELADAGIPAGVMVAPVIPGLTDHEIPSIIDAAAAAGARQAGYVVLRLPHALAGLFETWLEDHFPGRKEKVLNRIRAVRGGKLNDPRFGSRMRGEGAFADEIESLFRLSLRKAGIDGLSIELSTSHFRRPGYRQLTLFDDP
jgi:DNA repair photolyase